MAGSSTNPPELTSLILRATSPLHDVNDPNLVHSVCQEIGHDPTKIHSAVRLIVHKMQSPHEKEAMQSLVVLQACVINCGENFQAEIGKFRFLNELIKLVSPKYSGNQTALAVKNRVFDLLYTWTIDLKQETKINEAFEMLKNQSVLSHDPSYLGSQIHPSPKIVAPASFEDEQKSRLLQRLLQSKKPEDISRANALIKTMVNDDERKLERTSRRIIEVETALNNVKVLNDMLTQYHTSKSVTSADLDLMRELYNSCNGLRANIYRTVSEMDDDTDGIGEFLRASDELSAVMGRYKLEIEGKGSDWKRSAASNKEDQDCLLDLSPDIKDSKPIPATNLEHLGLGDLDLSAPVKSSSPVKSGGILGDLTEVFVSRESPAASASPVLGFSSTNGQMLPAKATLVPEKSQGTKSPSLPPDIYVDKRSFDPLSGLDQLSSDLLKQSLPPNYALASSQFKNQDSKLPMNQMKSSSGSEALNLALNPNSSTSILPPAMNNDLSPLDKSQDIGHSSNSQISQVDKDFLMPTTVLNSVVDESPSLLNHPQDIGHSTNSQVEKDVLKQTTAAGVPDDIHVSSHNSSDSELLSDLTAAKVSSLSPLPVSNGSKAQLSEVKPLNDIFVALEEIKPGKQSSVSLIDSEGISVVVHFTENRPREDVFILVVSVSSKCPHAIADYLLQAVGPKGCKVRLLPPSSTEMAEYSPFLPPPAITQIMLIANPNQLNVSLKVMLSYSVGDEPMSVMGEIDRLPL